MTEVIERPVEDARVRLVRTYDLLRHSVAGSRLLDCLVAEAIGWQSKVVDGRRYWRRFRTTWAAQTNAGMPPRYTTHLELLMGEVPRDAVLSLEIAGGRTKARLTLGDQVHEARGATPELVLAGVLVWARGQRSPETAFSELGGRP